MGNNLCCSNENEPSKSEQSFQQPVQNLISSYTYRNIEITLVQGEFHNEKADVIINACQGNPYNPTESVLLRKAGQQLQQKLMGHHPPPAGEACHTDAGQLKCKNIIHIQLPKWDGENGGRNDIIELIQAYTSVMKQIQQLKAESIIFTEEKNQQPFQYPKMFHINAICVAVTQFIDQNQDDCPIKSIKFISTKGTRNLDFEIRKRLELSQEEILLQKERERFSNLEKQLNIKSTQNIQKSIEQSQISQNQSTIDNTTQGMVTQKEIM